MGVTFETEMAYVNIDSNEDDINIKSLNGQLVGTARAKYLIDTYGRDKIKFTHAILDGKAVSFTHSDKREDFFSINTPIDKLSEGEKRRLHVHPLHSYASKYIESGAFEDMVLDGDIIKRDTVISYLGDSYKLYYAEGKYIIPDAVINTGYNAYYLEFNNTHKVDENKLVRYRKAKQFNTVPFKVIEIDISDLCDDMLKDAYADYTQLLIERIAGISKHKRTLDLAVAPEKEEARWGRCYYCNTPLELVANSNDENFSNRVPKSIKRVKMQIKGVDESDKVSLGSAMLECPNCKAEHRLFSLYCPDCMTLRHKLVPLKLLTSENGRTFLHCPFNLMLSELDHGVTVSPESACNFSITIYDENSHYDKQFNAVGDFSTLYQKNTGTRRRKKLDSIVDTVKKNKEWKGSN